MKKRLCIAGMIALVIAALFLPQVVFAVQDKYRMAGTEVETRESLDISQLNMSYEMQMNARMRNLLKTNQPMVTGLDYEVTEGSEQAALLEKLMYQDWFYGVIEYSINISLDFYASLFDENIGDNIQECRKYIVYGSNYKCVLMMWYFDIYLPDIDTRMQLAVDTETDTIYYMKLLCDKQREKTDGYPANEAVFYLLNYIDLYYTYYEADSYALNAESENYGTNVWLEENSQQAGAGETVNYQMQMDEEQYLVEFDLPYGETSMTFQLQAVFGDGDYPDIYMGIAEIGELIPEMMQD